MARPTDAPIIDFGAHHYRVVPEETAFIHSFIEEADGEPIVTDVDAVVDRFDAAGVDGAVLSQPFYMGNDDAERTAAGNDHLLELVDSLDGYYALAAIPTAAGGEAAAAEFERCLERGANGGALETSSHGVELTDPSLEPVFEVAERADAPVLVHPKLDDSLGPDVLDDDLKLNAVFGREVALAASICSVIHEGVLDRHPDLALVYHHTGGNVASMLPRIQLQLDPGRWPGLDDLKSAGAFTAQLEERIYLDTAGYFGDPAPLRRTLEVFPAANLLFGTDFPYETRRPADFERFRRSIVDVAPDREAAAILGGNALDVLANVD